MSDNSEGLAVRLWQIIKLATVWYKIPTQFLVGLDF